MDKKRYVIITAGGVGTRMGGSIIKQFLEVGGKPILLRTIELFAETFPDIEIIVTLPSSHKEAWKEYCFKNNVWLRYNIVSGGFTRYHSVQNGLKLVPDGALVAVHDGVRPFVPKELLREMFNYNFTQNGAAGVIPIYPVVDTLREVVYTSKGDIASSKTVDRDKYITIQTPQIFNSTILKECYKNSYSPEFTDDASVVESCGYKVDTIIGSRINIKITTPDDLLLAESFTHLLA